MNHSTSANRGRGNVADLPAPPRASSRHARGLLGGGLAAAVVLVACGGGNDAIGTAKLPEGARSEVIEHMECDDDGEQVETLDTNNDGKVDIRTVRERRTGHVICRIVDLNHDNKPDLYEYFDRKGGEIRRREFCFDDTGVVNVIEYYEGGKLVRREKDTTGLHRIDTWDFFDPNAPPDPRTNLPRPIRRERDTDGNGRIDQWWVWEGDKVTITSDKNGDGVPDPDSAVTLGEGGQAPAAPEPPTAPAEPAATSESDAGGGEVSAAPAHDGGNSQ